MSGTGLRAISARAEQEFGMLILIIVIIAVGYLVSLRIHPLRKCALGAT